MRLEKFGLLVASTLVIAGCSFGSSESPTSSASSSTTSTASPSPSSTVVPTKTKIAAIYYVGDTAQGLRLYREFRHVTVHGSNSLGLESLRYLTAQGSHSVDSDYTNLWGNGSVINSVSVAGSKAIVDLKISHLNVGSEGEMRAIDQLVWTLTANDRSVKSVRFTSDGEPIESFAGHVDTTVGFARERSYDVLAPIWVTSPGAVVGNPVTIKGTACTFEAGIAWKLTRSGIVVKHGSVTAQQACPVRSVWQVSLGTLTAGTYTFTAIDYSAKDGSVTQQDSKKFTVK